MIKKFIQVWRNYRDYLSRTIEPMKEDIWYIRRLARKDLIRSWGIVLMRNALRERREICKEHEAVIVARRKQRHFGTRMHTVIIDDYPKGGAEESEDEIEVTDLNEPQPEEKIIHEDHSLNLMPEGGLEKLSIWK